MMPNITVYDLAWAHMMDHAGRDPQARVEFIGDKARRRAAFERCPMAAVALDVVDELLAEVRAEASGDHSDADIVAEARRRAREPEALERLRQRLKGMLNAASSRLKARIETTWCTR